MFDFSKITQAELTEIKRIAQRAIEKSELERYYLFTQNTIEKARVYSLCHRILININNLMDDCDLRKEINKILVENNRLYLCIKIYLDKIQSRGEGFGLAKLKHKLFIFVNKPATNHLIDLFAVLLEKANLIKVSKLKGIILEGRSGETYNKMFKVPKI